MDNPFETPQADLSISASPATSSASAYRDGDMIVVALTGASLPDVCVKTGAPTAERLQRKLQWIPPWAYLFLLFNVLIFLIVSMIVRKRVEVEFAVCAEALAERKKHMWIGGGAALFGVLLFFGIGVSPILGIVGFIAFLGGIIYASVKARLLWPAKMDKEWAWLKGANPRVLADLPVWGG